jgi:histidinol dehydrogenase
MDIDPVKNHRSREGGAIVYPVFSRRSGGLSVGINLFPDHKCCSFDCPYCEVFPFETDIQFSPAVMEEALRSALTEAVERTIPIRDICFSGNGEPLLSPNFPSALEAAVTIRDELAPRAHLVLITNGSGLLDEALFELLRRSALNPPEGRGLHIWLKLDAGTEAWYRAIDRSSVPFGDLLDRIGAFAASGAPFTLQTMVCRVKGSLPPPAESAAWVRLAAGLAAAAAKAGPGLRGVQIYGKARPAPEDPETLPAPPEVLEERAAAHTTHLAAAGLKSPGEVLP